MKAIVKRKVQFTQTGLAQLDAATAQLAKASTLSEVKDIRDKAEAIRKYAAASGAGLEIQNAGAELKLRAERKAGAMIPDQFPQGRPKKGDIVSPFKLSDAGISRKQSERWQAEATVPEEVFEQHIQEVKEDKKELTSASVLKLAKNLQREKKKKERNEKTKDKTLPKTVHLYHCSCLELIKKIELGKLDAIVTDPPYPKEYLVVFKELRDLANSGLKEGGSVFVMVGQSYLPWIMETLGEFLDYHWTLCYLTPSATLTVWGRKVMTGWKPVLWFTKGKPKIEMPFDVIKSEKPDKEHHEWGQSESGFASLIETFTNPGELICDPFMGAGTTGLVCHAQNRHFIGCDIDEDCVKTTKSRIGDYDDRTKT